MQTCIPQPSVEKNLRLTTRSSKYKFKYMLGCGAAKYFMGGNFWPDVKVQVGTVICTIKGMPFRVPRNETVMVIFTQTQWTGC